MGVKKRLVTALAVSVLTLAMAACGSSTGNTGGDVSQAGGNDAQSTAQSSGGDGASYELNIGSSVTTGSYYQWVLPMTEMIHKYNDNILVNPVPTGGSSENISYMEGGEAELGGVTSGSFWGYLNGQYDYDTPHDGISVFCSTYGDYYYILVRKDSPINSIADMEGCTFNITPNTSAVNGITHNLFSILGYDVDAFCNTTEMSHADALSGIQDGSVDAMAIEVGLGNATIMELAASNAGLKIVPMTQQEAQAIEDGWPGYFVKTIPAGSYDGVDEDVTTVGAYFLTLIRDDVPEDAAYAMAKTLFENNAELAAAITLAEETTAENTLAATGNGEVLPLHPGVERYLKEAGYLQ